MADCVDPPGPPDPLVLITEIANDGTNTFVELHNPGTVTVELNGWALCHRFHYTASLELDEVVIPPRIQALRRAGNPWRTSNTTELSV